jgi:subtilisin family serine protease
MATPHVTSVAALLLLNDSSLTQSEIESILKSTALGIPNSDFRNIWDNTVPATITWDTDCNGTLCDPVVAGLL